MYQDGGNSIGTLLRLIQEEKAQSQAIVNPGDDPSSPIRQTVTEPIRSPESPGSERVVSIRPESAIQSGPEGSVMGPVAPQAIGPIVSAPRPAVIGPRAAPTPVPTPTQPMSQTPAGSTSQPSQNNPSSSQTSSPTRSVAGASTRPSIGTSITSQPKVDNRPAGIKNILDYNKYIYTPGRNSVGGRTVEQLTPTPKPGQDRYVPGKGWQKPSGEFYKKDTWGVS